MSMSKTAYFMKIAQATALRSKDLSTKVGCVIVDENDRIVSTGYNGFVSKCDETLMTFERPLKYNLTIHAEMNALLYSGKPLKNCILYSTHIPCDNCLKHILQSGIRTIYYEDDSIMDRFTIDQINAIELLVRSTKCSIIKI
jgi:dCMP deaminase